MLLPQLASNRGYVPYETAFAPGTPVGPAARRILATPWTFPQLSIALAPGGRVATIIGNPPSIASPAVAPPVALPPIPGVDYSAYLKALATTP